MYTKSCFQHLSIYSKQRSHHLIFLVKNCNVASDTRTKNETMSHLHVETAKLLAVIRSTPMVGSDSKEYVIEALRRQGTLGLLRKTTVNSFVLGMAMGVLRGDPKLRQPDLDRIVDEVRNLDKLPFVN